MIPRLTIAWLLAVVGGSIYYPDLGHKWLAILLVGIAVLYVIKAIDDRRNGIDD